MKNSPEEKSVRNKLLGFLSWGASALFVLLAIALLVSVFRGPWQHNIVVFVLTVAVGVGVYLINRAKSRR